MDDVEINKLAAKCIKGTISKVEMAKLERWYQMDDHSDLEVTTDIDQQHLGDRMFALISEKVISQSSTKYRLNTWSRISAAAALIICMGAGLYFYQAHVRKQQFAVQQIRNIIPGSNKAILTLAGGRKIILANAGNGQLAEQENTTINKTADGELIYQPSKDTDKDQSVQFNTMTTPRGGQYHLTLADGTLVWLNAASSITYPVAFAGKERRVEISGEAYFEVAHNAAKPFKVVSRGQLVEVLGTHFNINAYQDETSVKTTLLQGSVKISGMGTMALLKPGQQSVFEENKISVSNANTEAALAWKNNYFQFTGSDIKTIMRQFARWYDVDVEFKGHMPANEFAGKIPRNAPASEVFEMLKHYRINCVIEGKKVMVTGY